MIQSVNPSDGKRKIQGARAGDDSLNETQASLSAFVGVGAMGSNQ